MLEFPAQFCFILSWSSMMTLLLHLAQAVNGASYGAIQTLCFLGSF